LSHDATGGFYSFDLAISWDGCPDPDIVRFHVGGHGVDPWATYSWVATSNGTVALSVGQKISDEIGLGFGFPFFGSVVTSAWIDCNGYICLVAPFDNSLNEAIPHLYVPNGFIAPYWDNLDPKRGTARWAGGGSAPSRYWVAEWDAWRKNTDNHIVFQAVLRENGSVRFQYGEMGADGRGATIGMESQDGSWGVQYSCNQAGSVTSNMAVEFLPMDAPSPDDDGDRLPDEFERFYMASLSQAGTNDLDQDGMSNAAELRAGTDPSDADSALRIESVTTDGGGETIARWQSIPGLGYSVAVCTNLVEGTWTDVNTAPVRGAATGMNAWTANVGRADGPFYLHVTSP
jgi:hypothetical protein